MFTANQGMRGGRAIELKKTVDTALEKSPSVKTVFIYKRTDNVFQINKERDIVIDDVSIIFLLLSHVLFTIASFKLISHYV